MTYKFDIKSKISKVLLDLVMDSTNLEFTTPCNVPTRTQVNDNASRYNSSVFIPVRNVQYIKGILKYNKIKRLLTGQKPEPN